MDCGKIRGSALEWKLAIRGFWQPLTLLPIGVWSGAEGGGGRKSDCARKLSGVGGSYPSSDVGGSTRVQSHPTPTTMPHVEVEDDHLHNMVEDLLAREAANECEPDVHVRKPPKKPRIHC